ncbi:MAG: DUF1566 domain-containing protein [Desulfovibrionaceae bacterium]
MADDTSQAVYPSTGQTACFDTQGRAVPCRSSGQDAAFSPGRPWPSPRFEAFGKEVLDRYTGLRWRKNANEAGFPMTWTEALQAAAGLNADAADAKSAWRLPNRRELLSMVSFAASNPCLPDGHPFENVFAGWCWTSTSSAVNPAYAWCTHLLGARTFYSRKDQYAVAWPVRGASDWLPRTGQTRCYDAEGAEIDCRGTMQDGAVRTGAPWPVPRFEQAGERVVRDRLTGLVWTKNANLAGRDADWTEALNLVTGLDAGGRAFRLPTIMELESLVDASRAYPALPDKHPFDDPQEALWSSTSSGLEQDWAMCLYLGKGAVGVGRKDERFAVWAVAADAS